jgi:hypothetical protein
MSAPLGQATRVVRAGYVCHVPPSSPVVEKLWRRAFGGLRE